MKWKDLGVAGQDAEIFEGELQEFLDVPAYQAYEVLKGHFGLPTIYESEGVGYLTFWIVSEKTVFTVDMVMEGGLADFKESERVNGVYLSGVGIMAEDRALKEASDIARRELKEFTHLLTKEVEKYSKQAIA